MTNEENRAAAETERKAAETSRQQAETRRGEAEEARTIAEQARQSAEQARRAAEKAQAEAALLRENLNEQVQIVREMQQTLRACRKSASPRRIPDVPELLARLHHP